MKKKEYLFIVGAWAAMGLLSGCTDDASSLADGDYHKDDTLIAEAEEGDATPYITEGMQALIDRLQAADEAVSLDEILPGLEEVGTDTMTDEEASLVAGATEDVLTGFDNYATLFRDVDITLSPTSSLFKSALGDDSQRAGAFKLAALVYWKYARFDNINYLGNAAQGDDITGVSPGCFEGTSITNDTPLLRGYAVQTDYAGYAYTFYTYVFVIYYSEIADGFVYPAYKGDNTYIFYFDWLTGSLQWRYKVIRK